MAPGDRVVSILDGSVTFAGEKGMNGKYVVIKHDSVPDPADLTKKTTLYSCYLHLSELSVETGDSVKEGDMIGRTGSTGNSTGEHLHFQIDRDSAPFHPYFCFTMAEAQAAGKTWFQAVNDGLGLDKARLHTVSPLKYLDSLGKGFDRVVSGAGSTNAPTTTPTTPVNPTLPANVTLGGSTSEFSDVPKSHPYHDAITTLAKEGIVSGDGSGKFLPDTSVSRSEILKMALKTAKIPLVASEAGFSDVSSGAWYAPYVATAKARGILSGYPDGTFKPAKKVTRAEALKIIVKSLSVTVPNYSSEYVDVQSSDWVAPFAALAKKEKVFFDDDTFFFPDAPMTRGEVASTLVKIRS